MERTLGILAERGHTYKAEVSDPVGGDTNKERYAFLWRDGAVELIGSGQIWDDQGDQFIREPFIASFRAGSFDFTLITIHVIFGSSKSQRRAEAMVLDEV